MACATGYMITLKRLSVRYTPWFLTAVQAVVGMLFYLPILLMPFTRMPDALPTGYHGLPGPAGQVPPRQRHSGHQIGLANIRERLELHFDAEANLKTYSSNGEFVVQVQLPLVASPGQSATSVPGLRPPEP